MPTALDWRHPEIQKKLGAGDVLIFQRNVMHPDIWGVMDYWRALGKAVVVDLDDHYPQIPPSNPAFEFWIENKPGLPMYPPDALEEGLRHADALTAPSKVLLDDWKHVVKGYWFPNWPTAAYYKSQSPKPVGAPDHEMTYKDNDATKPVITPRPDTEGKIVIGWGGSLSHVDSFVESGVCGALKRIMDKYPNVLFKLCGNETRLDYIFKDFGDKLVRQQGVRPEHWATVVSTFDIGIAPLDLRPLEQWRPTSPIASYDERRSWLKGTEYMCAGVPWVGSMSKTYEDLRRFGALVENTEEAWFGAMQDIIENLSARKKLALDIRDYALRKYTLERNVGRLGDMYRRILADKGVSMGMKLPNILYVEAQHVAA